MKNSICQYAYGCLAAGKSQAETLELVKQAFPACKTSKAGIAWYASKLKTGKAKLHDVQNQPTTVGASVSEAQADQLQAA